MECTQRLECTQELYESHTERICPEQIGFLGICGTKHPILRGPNKVGRDPQSCQIVLNLNSVSRQHAVINVLNSKEYMLMDLDSANKTKLLNKTLQPYIPHPMKDGDTVQFGDIFGIFRILEENDDLPMTQAIDIPETPAPNRYVSKLNKAPTTVIPESPDVSDRDDSFLSTHTERTRLSSGQFIKPFGKTLSLQRISSPKIDTSPISSKRTNSINANTSMTHTLKSVKENKNTDNIHEMNTQIPYPINPNANESSDSIYTADTQVPGQGISPSIHSLATQIPTDHLPQVRKIDGQSEIQVDIYAANKENDLSIYNADTQPFVSDKNELVDNKRKSIETKETDVSPKAVNVLNKSEEELLFDDIDDGCLEDFNSQPLLPQESPKAEQSLLKASTKVFINESDNSTDCEDIDMIPSQKGEEFAKKCIPSNVGDEIKSSLVTKLDKVESDDLTDCDDIAIIPTPKVKEIGINNNLEKLENAVDTKTSNSLDSNVPKECEDIDLMPTQIVEVINPEIPAKIKQVDIPKASKRVNRIKSDSSTDCEDVEPATIRTKTKELTKGKNVGKRINRIQSDSSTDCEDIALMPTQIVLEKKTDKDEDITDCEDDLLEVSLNRPKDIKSTKFEDMPTQVIDLDPDKLIPNFDEMDTQIIEIDENASKNPTNGDSFEDQPTQIINEIPPNDAENIKNPLNEIISPFKIPLQSPLRVKSKDTPKIVPKHQKANKSDVDNINYYNATQDIMDDLCTQTDESPVISLAPEKTKVKSISPTAVNDDEEMVPCSVEGYKVGERFANIERQLTPTKKSSYEEETVKNFVGNLSRQEVCNVIGVEPQVDNLKKVPSESSSDIDCTPKKVRSFLFTDSDLPNSQEIENNIVLKANKSYPIESSSESEPEENTEDQFTPFIHRKKKKPKTVAKIDLTKRFDVDKLPERIITRVRKPTSKMQENFETSKKITTNILKPKFITEQEDQIDEEIVKENVIRLKAYGRAKSKDNMSVVKSESVKYESKTESKDITKELATENIVNTSKDKIKVKIEKPKRKALEKDKETKTKEGSSLKEQEQQKEKAKEKKGNGDSVRNSSNDKNEVEVETSTRSTRSRRKNNDKNEKKSVSPKRTKNDIKESDKKSLERTKKNDNKISEKKSVSPERTKRGRPRKKDPPSEPASSEVEIRRSRRNAKPKEKSLDKEDSQVMQAPKSILKKSLHEQSAVYNVSSSSAESPKNLKRSLGDDSDVPSPKRTRAFVNNTNSSVNNVSLRATPARTLKTQHVLFTAFPSDEVKHKLEKLGAVVVTNVMECSVVLTMQVKRTFKLLCAVGLGRPIVGPDWVQACVDTKMLVDPWLYLVKDESAEKRFQFNLERTLNGKRNFLNGYNVSSTPSVQPNASEMKLIVECSGGVWKEGGSNWICVSSTKDQSLWPALRKRGATVVTTEFILGGVLRQKIEIIANKFP